MSFYVLYYYFSFTTDEQSLLALENKNISLKFKKGHQYFQHKYSKNLSMTPT